MKLGSIVGIVLSCLLIISGIVLCARGRSMAEDSGQNLLVQMNKDGTYYNQKIDDSIKRIKIEYEDADIQIKGGASRSQIEFRNFNPNYYAMSVTSSIITFEETPRITSITDIWENGFNFKGLRYALSYSNKDFEGLKKSVIISLADDTDIKNLDIIAVKGAVQLSNVNLDGDISISIRSGKIKINNLTSSSSLDISGNNVKSTIEEVNAPIFRYNVTKSDADITNCIFTESTVNVNEGTVNYSTNDVLTNEFMGVSTEKGILTVNTILRTEPIKNSPTEFLKKLTISGTDVNINLTYPETPTDSVPEEGADASVTE